MSKHHTLPPIIYTPPPKPKKIEKKRRIGIGMLSELDETADTRESRRHRSGGADQSTALRRKTFPRSRAPNASRSTRAAGSAKAR